MIGTLQCVVLDCTDSLELARFYRGLVGGDVNRPDRRWSLDDGWATLHTPAGFVLCFQTVEDHRPPRWGDPTRPQQSHLDIDVESLATAHHQVTELGATMLDERQGWRIYADPAGHPFCLIGRP
ncbi:VOC family protein [Nonomuraea sp. NPDC050556]|uniref:VOC family protein n=1 Tax=Nonomuraea sp. NPDC050556 TaxID=3364369 RepID=UPI0037902D83